MIAQVAVSCAVYAIDQPYSYRIPQGMQILPGMRVVVPFGRANRRTEAIVLGVQTGSEDKLKAIEQLLDDAGIGYTVYLAEEHRDAARTLGIRQAPTLVSGGQKWAGVSGIRAFLAARENTNV